MKKYSRPKVSLSIITLSDVILESEVENADVLDLIDPDEVWTIYDWSKE